MSENQSVEITEGIIDEMINDKKKEDISTIEDDKGVDELLANGDLVKREDLQALIDAEIEKRKDELRSVSAPKDDSRLIESYKQLTHLTDEKFIKQLIRWHVNIEMAEILSDHQSNLTQKKVWEYLRENYKPKRKK
jgi:hypothetical protein